MRKNFCSYKYKEIISIMIEDYSVQVVTYYDKNDFNAPSLTPNSGVTQFENPLPLVGAQL